MAGIKGTKDSRAALGADGKKDVLLFDPENLTLVEDGASVLYDERIKLPTSEALVLNIMTYGVIEPIVVRKNPETGAPEVVAGRQRVKACREANRRLKASGCEVHRIAAIVKRGDPAALMGVMVSESRRTSSGKMTPPSAGPGRRHGSSSSAARSTRRPSCSTSAPRP